MVGLHFFWRLAAAVSLGFPATLTGLFAALYGGLQTDAGRQLATPLIENRLGTALETDTVVEGLTELSVDRIRMAGLKLGGQQDPWLSAESIEIVWRPFSLPAGRLSIPALAVERLTLHRTPPDTDGGEPLTANDFRPPLALDVEHLSVTTLRIEAPVLGEAATLGVEGEATARADGNGVLRLDVVRRDGPGGRLSARADYGLATRRLDLALQLDEPANGVLARLLDLPGRPAIALKLDGAGTLDSWRGRLSGEAEELAALDSSIELALDTRFHLTLEGKADIAGLLPEGLRPLAAPELNLAFDAAWEPEGARLAISDGRFSSRALDGSLSGTVDGSSLQGIGKLSLRLLDADALTALTTPATIQAAEATVAVAGSFTRPAGRIEARLAGLAVPGASAETTEFAADFELAEGLGGPVTMRSRGRLSGLTTTDQNLRSVVGRDVEIEAEARIRTDGGVDLTAVTLQAAAAKASLSGAVTADGVADLAGSAEMPDLAVLNSLLGLPVMGQASAAIALRLAADSVHGTVAADIRQLDLPEAGPAAGLVGPEVSLAADIRSDAPGTLRIENLSVDGRGVSATGKAVLLKDFSGLEAEYRLRLSDLSPLAAATGMAITGTATLEGTADGTLAAPRLKGRIEATVRTPWDAATLRADATVDDLDRLRLRNIEAATLGTAVSGSLDVGLMQERAEGRLRAVTGDLAAWSPLIGMPVAGRLEADIELSAPAGRQDVRIDLKGADLRVSEPTVPVLSARHLGATVVLADALGTRRIDGQVRLDDVAFPNLRLDGIDVRAQGAAEKLGLTLSGQGPSLAVETAGILAVTSDAIGLEVAKLSGSAFGQDFVAAGPARFRYADNDLAVSGLRLQVGGGMVATDLRLNTDAVDMKGTLDRLPLSLLSLVDRDFKMDGTVDGEIRLEGAPAAPTGRLALTTQGASVSVGGEAVNLQIRTEGVLTAGSLALRAKVEGPGEAHLTAEGRLSVGLSAAPFELNIPTEQPISATVSGRGDLGGLIGQLIGDPHVVTGSLDLQMDLSGSAAHPLASGDIRIASGRYENIVTGTLVRDIGLEARLDGDRLEIVRATGLAGNGRIDVSGSVGLTGNPLDVRVGAEKALVVERDDLALTVSGDLALGGSIAKPSLTGTVTVNDAELGLVDETPPQVTTLDVVEVNAPDRQIAEPPAAAAASELALDLAIAVPNRLFVRGQGLDSEWSGSLRVTGTMAAPVVAGQLTPVRGQVSFAGKTFVLQTGSNVSFRAPDSTTPVLDLTAEYEGRDFIARFIIRGPADTPEITLSSSPELPQDEIVSRILFGRGVAKISAIEAAQLAQAITSLSGTGGSDFLETARRAFGVDVLRIEAGEGDSGPAVAAGRYLSRDVYVGVSQGTGLTSGQAQVEVEVIPNVTIETEVGPTTGGEIGARWKYDY